MLKRKYRGIYETQNGDIRDFEYYSYFRNNSKLNMADARYMLYSKYGHGQSVILQTYLI